MPTLADLGKKKQWKNVKIHHIHTEGAAEYNAPDCAGIFRSNSLFTGANCRHAINEGRADFTPIFLGEIPLLFFKKIIEPDVSLIQVTPADNHGNHSLGTSVDCVRAALIHSKYVIAQVNPRMPRTNGDAVLHTSHIDVLVDCEMELPEHKPKPLTDIEKQIGKHIVENLIENGATIQMGIGSIPDAVLALCGNHKDLGIHSEMFSDGVVDLVEKGVITNRYKAIEQGRIVGSFIIGSRRLFDFVDDNPFISE